MLRSLLTCAGIRSSSSLSKPARSVIVAATLGCASWTPAAEVNVSWKSAVTDLWRVGTRWSGNVVPNNNATTTFNVTIAANSGFPYTVNLADNDSFVVNRLTINNQQGAVGVNSGRLEVLNGLDIQSGSIGLSGGGQLRAAVTGGPIVMFGGVLDGCTINSEVLARTGSNGRITGGLAFGASNGGRIRFTQVEGGLGPATLRLDGTQEIAGTGSILFDGIAGTVQASNGTVTLGSGITVQTTLSDGTLGGGGFLLNRGVIRAQHPNFILRLEGAWRNEGTLQLAGGELRLGGTYKTADIGQVQRNSGSLLLVGAQDNTNAVLDSTALGIPIFIGGGAETAPPTILGGTIRSAAQFPVTAVSGVGTPKLEAVSIDGYMVAQTFRARGLNMLPGSAIEMTGRSFLGFNGADQTGITGNGTLLLNNGTLNASIAASAIGPGITITGGGGLECSNLDFRGTVLADGGKSITFSVGDGSFVNNGRLIARGGGTISLAGPIAVGGLGDWSTDGGVVEIRNRLENAGNTLLLDGPHHVLSARTGIAPNPSIHGGTLLASNGGMVKVTGDGALQFDGVYVDSDVAALEQAGLQFSGASVLPAGRVATVNGRFGILSIGSLSGGGEIRLSHQLGEFAEVFIDQVDGITIRTAPANVVVRQLPSLTRIINHAGTLSAETSGRSIWLKAGQYPGMDNRGVLRVSAGSFLCDAPVLNNGTIDVLGGQFILGQGWSNASGLIRVGDNGSLTLRGTFATPAIGSIAFPAGGATSAGGYAQITGTLNNAGQTLSVGVERPIRLGDGGRISGGTLSSLDGSPMRGSGTVTLQGLTLAGDFALDSGRLVLLNAPPAVNPERAVVINSTSTLPASASQLLVPWSGTLDGFSLVLNGDPNAPSRMVNQTVPAPGVLSLGPSMTIRTGPNGGSGELGTGSLSLLSGGTITASGSAKRLTVLAGTFENRGTIRASDRALLRVDVSNVAGFVNRVGGTVSGTNVLDATLAGGNWIVDGGTIDLRRTTIARNDATIRLFGPTSSFPAIAPLQTNNGVLELSGGFDFITIGALENTGTMAIGPDTDMSVTDLLVLSSSSTLQFALSNGAIDGFGRLSAAQSMALDGELEVRLIDGYVPSRGDQYRLLEASVITGDFDMVRLPTLGGGDSFELTRTSTTVTLKVVPEPAFSILGACVLLCVWRSNRWL